MHKSKVTAVKVLSDGQLAVKVRCCEDESTASWLTVNNTHEHDADSLREIVVAHQLRVEAHHAKRDKAHAFLKSLTETL